MYIDEHTDIEGIRTVYADSKPIIRESATKIWVDRHFYFESEANSHRILGLLQIDMDDFDEMLESGHLSLIGSIDSLDGQNE